ncbi:hypothetical protein C6A37_03585 [Desulfobacteraceae bacterium SEEP-SAG9]|nr:hypothetical protein C6A37_03585 [Desulfobacteraceae bacterium SEEP-SAG9]
MTLNAKWSITLSLFTVFMSVVCGCVTAPKKLEIEDISGTFGDGTIISTQTGKPLSFEVLLEELANVQIIYIGEQHTNGYHHTVQLKVIREFLKIDPDIVVGMEMFDRTYQPILDQWSSGQLDQKTFLQKVHWYANWKFNFELYSGILNFIKEKKIRLVGLIHRSDPAHRAYVKEIFNKHHMRGRKNFEYFYEAQCVWEDIMAESIVLHRHGDRMIILTGNGHIIHKFGIPNRTFRRTEAPFKTIYPATIGSKIKRSFADYIWVTPPQKNRHPR